MKILNFGSFNIDYVYKVDRSVQTGQTIATKKMEIFAGGKGLNQSVAAARAGATVYHAGVIGEDGAFLKEILEQSGADVSFVLQKDCKNGHAIIQVDGQGNNCIIVYPGTNAMITKDYVDEVLSHFEAGDLVMLQNETSCVPYIMDKAFAKGMRVVLNPSPFTEEMRKIDLNKISYLLVNETEMEAFGLSKEEITEKYKQLHLVLTLGEKGCIYSSCELTFSQGAHQVQAVDTTAAGDTFTGYFLAGLTEGMPVPQALEMSAKASSIAVTRPGAVPSIPYRKEVVDALAEC